MAASTLTDDIWWAAQPPPVRALRFMQPAQKYAAIQALLLQGYLLNGPVCGWGESPAWQMGYLQDVAKEAWFPAMGYAQLAGAPGIIPEGPMPPWGIRVSTDAADYPPWPA